MNTAKELTKLTQSDFAEMLMDLLWRNQLNAGDGTVRVVIDLHFNEEQNILTTILSDNSVFYLKIR